MRRNVAPASPTTPRPVSTSRLPASVERITSLVSSWILVTSEATSAAAAPVCMDSLRTSSATTANPLPAAPARAASIEALSASMLVWRAIPAIIAFAPTIFSERPLKRSTETASSFILL
ncbi:hypothetical protein D3C85_1256880 [compost metagenome]